LYDDESGQSYQFNAKNIKQNTLFNETQMQHQLDTPNNKVPQLMDSMFSKPVRRPIDHSPQCFDFGHR